MKIGALYGIGLYGFVVVGEVECEYFPVIAGCILVTADILPEIIPQPGRELVVFADNIFQLGNAPPAFHLDEGIVVLRAGQTIAFHPCIDFVRPGKTFVDFVRQYWVNGQQTGKFPPVAYIVINGHERIDLVTEKLASVTQPPAGGKPVGMPYRVNTAQHIPVILAADVFEIGIDTCLPKEMQPFVIGYFPSPVDIGIHELQTLVYQIPEVTYRLVLVL